VDKFSTVTLNTGRAMPMLGLGTWQLTNDTAATVQHALRLGYRMIDTSSDYGTQPAIGEAIRSSDIDRGEIFVVNKIEEHDDAAAAAGDYRRELGLDYVDLTVIHRPPGPDPGPELWQGLIRARATGLARDIGVSNYTSAQIDALIDATAVVPSVNQIEWSPFGWSRSMLDYCRDRGIVIQGYSPLTRAARLDDDRLREIAAEYRKTPAQLMLRWQLQLGVVPLPKANHRDHLASNLDIFDFQIGDHHMRALSEMNERYSALGSLAYT
jgi:2,5-diketo-D-gluconate reductase A